MKEEGFSTSFVGKLNFACSALSVEVKSNGGGRTKGGVVAEALL